MNEMKRAKEIHDLAMKYADAAFVAKFKGQPDKAAEYFRLAFYEEQRAASIVAMTDTEPTRSVLHRSAATLALRCGETREAEKLAANALAGDPPEEIANELRGLLEKVNFSRHFEIEGLDLSDDDLQVTFAGNSISEGIAPRKEIFPRVFNLEKLLHRTDDRTRNMPFREHLGTKKEMDLYISTPRAASFSISLRLGMYKQLSLPNMDAERSVIDELMTCMELFDQKLEEELQVHISDPVYFRNFVRLAKKIAPDGDRISLVGLATLKNGKERNVSFSRIGDDILDLPEDIASESEIALSESLESVTGILRFADAMESNREIRLEVKEGKPWKVLVPEGYMENIVTPHWEKPVTVRGYKVKRKQKTLYLDDITEADVSTPLL